MRAVSDRSFLENIREAEQSTPILRPMTSAETTSSKKRRARKRKSVISFIDLTPNGKRKEESINSDSDVEIIEATAPEVIDLDEDSCSTLLKPNVTADTVITTEIEKNAENTISIDTVVSGENEKLDSPSESDSLEQTLVNIENENASNDVQQNIEALCPSEEAPELFINDTTGGGPIEPPLYDIVSDDSFCIDATPPQSQQSLSQVFSQISPGSLIEISDDYILMPSPKRKKVESPSTSYDDSVVFVSETRRQGSRAENFIRISNGNMRKNNHKRLQNRKRQSPSKPHQKSPNTEAIGTNLSDQIAPKSIKGTKRMIIIDGSNVAYKHSGNGIFSAEGIEICLNYFLDRGFNAKAIVPEMRLKKIKSSNQNLMQKLDKEQKLVLTPCKNLENGNVVSYDDRFILDFAAKFDAVVISNDNFRDLRNENKEYSEIINNRVVGYTFLNDVIAFPKDPYGKKGPSFEDILNNR